MHRIALFEHRKDEVEKDVLVGVFLFGSTESYEPSLHALGLFALWIDVVLGPESHR